MLAAVALALLGQMPCGPEGPIFCQGENLAFFEFAPLSGKGMTAPCACTTPTGAKGEALTFTRASSGTCLKGNTTTGIATGDMVTCTTDQPRVMPGGDGTGGLGLLVEGARTSSTVRSQEIDNAAWSTAQSGVAAPIITANAAAAPDGTTTAERLQVAATTGGQYAQVYQAGCPGANPETGSVFVKGVSGSGTLDLAITSGGATNCTACSYVSGSWSRCTVLTVSVDTTIVLGSSAIYGAAGCTGAAADVYVWGAQCEAGAFASSYIATTSAAVARAQDVTGFLNLTWPASATFSHAVTYETPFALPATTNARALGVLYFDANNAIDSYMPNSTTIENWVIGGVSKSSTASPALNVSASNHSYGYYDGAGVYSCANAVCSAPTVVAFTPPSGSADLCIGSYGADCGTTPYMPFGVVKKFCLDPSATRCR
jgi:hypothetical protein